jgi:hypothetical protein
MVRLSQEGRTVVRAVRTLIFYIITYTGCDCGDDGEFDPFNFGFGILGFGLGEIEDKVEAGAKCGMCRPIWRVRFWII